MIERLQIPKGSPLLVTRTDRVGDLVLALPFINSLASRYPDSPVDVMASVYASPVLDHHKSVRNTIRVLTSQLRQSARYRKEMLSRLSAYNYCAAIVLYPDRRIAQVISDASIPVRIGSGRRLHSLLFTHRLNHSRRENRKHESEYNLDFLQFFDDGELIRTADLVVTSEESEYARQQIQSTGVTVPFIAIHPGSGGSADRWPMDRFLLLARKLQEMNHAVLITGGPAEKSAIEEQMKSVGMTFPSLLGTLDLRGLIAVLEHASLTISNSTGPLHLAAAQGGRVVGLYPARHSMSPVRWGPLGEDQVVIVPPNPCNCGSGHCICLEKVSVEDVFVKIAPLLSKLAV